MATQLIEARRGKITEEMKQVALIEEIDVEKIVRRVARGLVIIPRNVRRKEMKIIGIGAGLKTKVNVNIGTSTTYVNLDMEIEKAKIAIKYGTDTIMDLSTGGDLNTIRRKLIEVSPVPFGTVPIYQAFIEATKKKGAGIYMDEDDIFNTIELHMKDGVDFMTIHAGITKDMAERITKNERVTGIVSRGGAILTAWMLHNEKENPLYENYDYLLEMVREYDAVISLGDALRPGSIHDAHDYLQIAEMLNVAKLVEKSWEKGVQVMVEGPGHMPLNQIAANIKLEKTLCKGAPYYVLGPLVTDTAAGYDHIAAAIGAAIAAAEGVDLICYLTPAEHLSLPNIEDVKEGLIAAKIAAHAGDIVKLGEKAMKKDLEISKARAALDWNKILEMAYDTKRAKEMYHRFSTAKGPCTMCGELCVYLLLSKFKEEK
ncbi:MAG: phosphomethylpyrimidine synthase ThiC [archaeon GB-1867-035]|nr:phosphomethylpyrimidine synthase ThiC [Candidatus Culexmicrobium profundum]